MNYTPEEIRKRKQELINKMISIRGPYDSSAEKLDNALLENNFQTAHRFSKNYQLPGNITPEAYEERFYRIYELPLRLNKGIITELENPQPGSLDEAVCQNIKASMPQKNILLREEFNMIKKLNPELEEIKPKTYSQLYDAVRGIIYKFNVADIKFFMNNPSEEEKMDATKFNIQFKKKHDINISYLLSKENREKLSSITEKREQKSIPTFDSYSDFMQFRKNMGHFND